MLTRVKICISKGNRNVNDSSFVAYRRSRFGGGIALMISATLALADRAQAENRFLQHNLVSDLAGIADTVDPGLVNPWGISASPTSPFWISNNHTGTAKIYDSAGKPASLVVTLHAPGGTNPSTPTGQVFNGTGSFVVPGGKPAAFLFATEDGTISGWYNGIANNEAATTVNNAGVVYKGLAIGVSDSGPVLYAADFRGGSVDVYSGDFSRKTLAGSFSDPTIPSGFAPFNVYVSGAKLYVAYAKQDDDREDDLPGDGNGYVDVFDLNGRLLQRLVSGGRLNSPWGMVIAPDRFGDFSKVLLVGNFGDGTINAFDPNTGAYLGTLQDANDKPIVNPGLWGLQFGNGASGGDSNALYFTAGISGPGGEAIESHGLFWQHSSGAGNTGRRSGEWRRISVGDRSERLGDDLRKKSGCDHTFVGECRFCQRSIADSARWRNRNHRR